MELERTRSPGYTCLVFESPSGFIFSDVEVMYRPMLGASPIFTQFSPAGSSVIYASMGRGDPPRSIRTRSENLRCSQAVIQIGRLHLGNSVSWETAGLLMVGCLARRRKTLVMVPLSLSHIQTFSITHSPTAIGLNPSRKTRSKTKLDMAMHCLPYLPRRQRKLACHQFGFLTSQMFT